jgi:hypothetical protein
MGRWKPFVYPSIDGKPLWSERIPGGEQCDGEHGENEFPFVHFHVSFEIRILGLIDVRGGSIAFVIVVMQLCAVATDFR